MLRQSNPAVAAELLLEAQHDVDQRWHTYEHLAHQSNANFATALQSAACGEKAEGTVNHG
jgi:hypothetical protein